jgi:UDP-N-acetylglucosamine acyltransferase
MENTTTIHTTAIVHPEAMLGSGVSVGAYSIIEAGVTIGDNTQIGNHCLITGQTTVGRDCQIYTGAIIGSAPQDLKHAADDNVFLNIGDHNIIREYVTINPGTVDGGGKTGVGHHNLFMAYAHIAHDCMIGNHCVLANAATLAGHVTMEDNAVIGGLSGVHQFVRLGRLSIVGGCSKVVQDIPPFSMCDGHPASVIRTNVVGLKRAGVRAETILNLNRVFRILFHSGLARKTALARIAQEFPVSPEIEHLSVFIQASRRGVCG